MVIISWNMAKSRSIPFEQVLRLCETWEASVVVIQEPTGSLLHFGSKSSSAQPRGCDLSWQGRLQQGGSQGSIVILSREGVSISHVTPVNLGTGQGTRQITATNPLVVFDAREGDESMRFATCHSPYDESARSTYPRNAVVEGGKRNVDCIIGDMNSYGTQVPGGTSRRSPGFHCPPVGPTSNRGRGSPLDKAYVADSVADYTAGRVIPGGASNVKDAQQSSDSVKDIVDSHWSECPSDHLPIFIAFFEQQCRLDKFFKPPEDDDGDDDEKSMPPPKSHKKGTGDKPGSGGRLIKA